MATNKTPGGAGGRTPGNTKHSKSAHSDNAAVAQRARLLATLKHRKLTTLQARRELDVLHPAARVMELRKAGHDVVMEWTEDVTSEGFMHRVARYVLRGAA